MACTFQDELGILHRAHLGDTDRPADRSLSLGPPRISITCTDVPFALQMMMVCVGGGQTRQRTRTFPACGTQYASDETRTMERLHTVRNARSPCFPECPRIKPTLDEEDEARRGEAPRLAVQTAPNESVAHPTALAVFSQGIGLSRKLQRPSPLPPGYSRVVAEDVEGCHPEKVQAALQSRDTSPVSPGRWRPRRCAPRQSCSGWKRRSSTGDESSMPHN